VKQQPAEDEGESLAVSGRGFPPGADLTLQCRENQNLNARVRTDAKGQFTTTLTLPPDLPYGTFTIEARGASGMLTSGEFEKSFADDELEERSEREAADKPTAEER